MTATLSLFNQFLVIHEAVFGPMPGSLENASMRRATGSTMAVMRDVPVQVQAGFASGLPQFVGARGVGEGARHVVDVG